MVCSACESCHMAMLDIASATLAAHPSIGLERTACGAEFESVPLARDIRPPIA